MQIIHYIYFSLKLNQTNTSFYRIHVKYNEHEFMKLEQNNNVQANYLKFITNNEIHCYCNLFQFPRTVIVQLQYSSIHDF